jgi:DNA helicase IV
VAPHPDLAAEQAHVDRSYARLDQMRAAAAEALQAALAHGKGGGTYQTLVERDVLVANSVQRMSRLELGAESLCFGRIDRETGEAFHIGRLAVSDEDHEPLVVDWRAPAAEPFYRATGREPLGLRRRRHFLTEGRVLVDLEDELFGGGEGEGGGHLGLAGSGALLAALERSRTGRMRDIVATVQREQDEIIRAPLAGIMVVQGGPGTGKTAVALHRAAYLLYTHRFPLERQGVLVIGPNPLFMRYIEQVLPSLGESGVELSTIGGLVPSVDVTGRDEPAAARLKGDARMARVVARAVKDRQRPLRHDVTVGYGPFVLRLTAAASAEIVAAARRRPGPHNARRALVERLLFQRLHDQHGQALARNERLELRPREGVEPVPIEMVAAPVNPSDLGRDLRRQPEIVEALERMWPVLTPEQLLRDLFGAAGLVRLAAGGVLSDAEQRLLLRPRGDGPADVAWTAADVPLLDEAAALLGPPRRRPVEEGDGSGDGPRTFGHIVVDEAQDLSPMQLRMLARRSLNGSMTLVGDIAQATGQWTPSGWEDVLAHLPARRGSSVVSLSVNYRTPAEVMALAGRVLAAARPGAEPPESVRSTGEEPAVVEAGPADVAGATARRAAHELAAVGDGRVAVICAAGSRAELASTLAGAGVPFGEARRRGLDEPVTLVPVELAKGLEFDAVVVVEPAAIVAEATNGLQALYVALTRTTRRLAIIHGQPLPAPLA